MPSASALSRKAAKNKPPTKVQREQARSRREAERDGKSKTEASLTPFVACFCREYVRWGILPDAHFNAEVMTKTPLDLTGFEVYEEKTPRTVKGKQIMVITKTIIDPATGQEIPESVIRSARAAQLWHMPEVKAECDRLRKEAAKAIEVTAESLAEELAQIKHHAIVSGQLQVAANVTAMKAKMFGVEAGSGGGDTVPPAASVNINIRDFTKKRSD